MQSGANNPSNVDRLGHAPFALEMYIREYKEYIDVERLGSMIPNGSTTTIYDTRGGVKRNIGFVAWILR